MSNTRDHKRFCENDGWELYKKTDHYYYRKKREDGTYKHTMVSMGRKGYSRGFWRMILNKQLECSQEYFNSKI